MDHDRQDVSTPATRCAAGIMPVAVSLSNAPPTATPSSVMGRFPSPKSVEVAVTLRAYRDQAGIVGPNAKPGSKSTVRSVTTTRMLSWPLPRC